MTLASRFQLATRPLAPQASVVTGDGWRVTVLTERLLRLEYSPDNVFEDRATQIVLNRDFPTPEFTVTRKGAGVLLRTSHLTLEYDGAPFWPGGLRVVPAGGTGYHQIWRYGETPHDWGLRLNLGGTARTLDAVDGETPLEDGILHAFGVAPLEDRSLALTDDGWVDQRAGGTDLYVFAYGPDAPAALRDFYRLTGPTPRLPRYALGNWWSRYHAYSDVAYLDLLDRFDAERLPFSVAVLDMDWHVVDIPERFGAGWTGYTWNRSLFPDPRAFLTELHRRGLATTLNVHPAEGVRGHEDAYPALAARLGLDAASEEPARFDIGNPDFVEPYFEEVHHPHEDDGVDFWWVDWQQGTASATPGLDPLWALNHFHTLDAARGGRRPLLLSRYAGPGSHRYPVGFSGDTIISWESLAFQPYFTATAANIGYGWWSHDIGGHMCGYRDAELTARWFQFGTFSPINRVHSSDSRFAAKEPWNFDAVHGSVMAEFLRLRHRLLPYLYTAAERAHTHGEALVRPLYYADPRPETVLAAQNAYLFGTELLVAPITSPVDARTRLGAVEAWLPAGRWIDLFTGLRYDGGRSLTLHRPIETLPVLAKAGGIVPLTTWDAGVGNPDVLQFIVAAGADGTFELYEDDDALEPAAVRTQLTWSDADRTFTVHPAQGELAVVPARRRITLRVLGLEPDAPAAGETFDPATNAWTIQLGEVDTAAGCSVALGPAATASNRELERVETLLFGAELEFEVKEKVYDGLAAEASTTRRLMRLEGLALEAELRSALLEIVLADPTEAV